MAILKIRKSTLIVHHVNRMSVTLNLLYVTFQTYVMQLTFHVPHFRWYQFTE